ncbi:hypothetical protein CMQ_7790 [Grosmannia clavigera kw1407]|uniref:Uncharacterized protein n=1 Tax=Grosmannia clavigera (strain kw1407 / UAMH 11150) TaxID=655863 RepID=F0XRW8_GROCL|nr:uncharacterized protein CMQ_7790 [Grosmannia clavigera kw1407]EFW99422.1 hypothetical protein CMQ_7790 [Grosmannia clavigera kw1407]
MEELKQDLEVTKLELKKTQVLLKQAEEKNNIIQLELEDYRAELEETRKELANVTVEWKASAGELRELKAKDQTGFLLTDGDLVERQLEEIFHTAVRLDEDIKQQVARVLWVYEYDGLTDADVDFETIEVKGDSSLAKEKKRSRERPVVIAPALVKRGKSTGQDFHIENTLLKIVVLRD